MKFHKIITATFFLLFTLNLTAQYNQNQEIKAWENSLHSEDSPVQFEDDLLVSVRYDNFEIGEFVYQGLTHIESDENGNRTLVLSLTWDGQTWNNSSRNLYEFDVNNNTTRRTNQKWLNGWENDNQTIYEFDTNNNTTLNLSQNWENGQWINNGQSISIYNTDNQLVEEYVEFYDNGVWGKAIKVISSYDSEGYVLEELFYGWNGSDWEIRFKTSFIHDEDGNQIEIDKRRWEDSTWIPDTKTIKEYNDQQRETLNISQNENNGEYQNNRKRETIINNENVVTRDFYALWIDNEWVNDNSRDYTTDDRDNLSYILVQRWAPAISAWENTGQYNFIYQYPSPIKEVHNEAINFTLSPNPNNGIFNIDFTESISDQIQIKIYTLEGKLVAQFESNNHLNKTPISLSHLGIGTYILSATSSKGSSSQKILIER